MIPPWLLSMVDLTRYRNIYSLLLFLFMMHWLFAFSNVLLQVVVKDFVSKVIISQFRAHTSPISALCFDPSGTLLVTASVHGHNINVFRIMPSRIRNASNSACYDWSTSHVHLYKLYRGLTTAVSNQNFLQYVIL